MNFTNFKNAITVQFARMQKHPLYRVDVDKAELWDTYLGAFPEGTNPIYRVRGEYDCNCCKQFIRAVGSVVAIVDGRITSIWEVQVPEEPGFNPVAKALSKLVLSRPIAEPFLHYERSAGTDRNFEQLTGGETTTWNHFFVNIFSDYVKPQHDIPTTLGKMRAKHDVLKRGLEEISTDSIETVLELVTQGSLYRGEEHTFVLEKFLDLKKKFDTLPVIDDALVWLALEEQPESVTRIRNSAIGTLLVDLSAGRDLQTAVGAFEFKVAPDNYKRPVALVTKGMVEKAKATLAELGLTSALDRRYANMGDITINNLLFADREARKKLTGDVFDDLSAEVGNKSNRTLPAVDDIPIEKFIRDILPLAESVEVQFENRHSGNLVSLVAPVDATAGGLFKWPNNFSWSYNGEVADSIKERVKKAGGSVIGDLCCRLAWHNYDDLDLHMIEPDGSHIFFADRSSRHSCGKLDVDMNAGRGTTREPVENIFYESRNQMQEGTYKLSVNQYQRRESDNIGFEVEIDYLGTTYNFAFNKPMSMGDSVQVAMFDYTKKGGFVLNPKQSLPMEELKKTVWGLPTQTFHRVQALMLSPNHWDGAAIGNKHYFFMLEGCTNDGGVRGFYNEFLKSSLDPHRKVFEIVGSKTKPADALDQLSGLGFSSTQRNTLTCRVKGKFTRTINIVF